jgi:peptidoglycan hydrolase-like protein with peptidoglycan-binding domain
MRRTTDSRVPVPVDEVELPARGNRPRAIVLAVIACVVLIAVFGGGWALANGFRSPAQQAAAASAPARGAVTTTVNRGALEQTIGLTATVARRVQQQIAMPSASSPSIMTKQPLGSGDQINAGAVIAEVNGRPVFAIPGAFPFYRDLSPGESGPDVRQLQEALKSAGYGVKPDGNFGAATEAALRAMYKSAGYQIAISEQSEAAAATPEASVGIAPPSVILIPRSELVAFTTLPAVVVSTPTVGTVLDATSRIIAEAGEIVATADVAPEVAAQMKAGMIGTLTGPDGQQVAITVGSVGAAVPSAVEGQDAAGQGASDGGVTGGATSGNDQSGLSSVVLIPADGPYPDAWLRSTVRAVITVQVASEESLLVPSIAVISGGNGSARVLKRLADGSFASVRVKETAVLSGRSAISPEKSNELTAGDLVRVN